MAASTTLISSTPSRAFSSKSTPLVASSSISKPISQTLTFPKSLNGLRLPRVAHSVSLSRGAHSRRSFLVKASADELPLVGNVAPDFEAEAVFDQEFIKVKLSEYIGKKYVILFFYPLDFTFVCPTEITAFSDRHAEFEQLNTEILGVSVDSVFSHLAWVQTDRKSGGLGDLNYPLISDVTKSISKSYGVLIPDQGIALRGLFIIDKEGLIQHSTINNLAIGRSVDETKRTLQALQYVQDNPDDSFHSLHPPNPKFPHFPILSTKTTLSLPLQSLKPPSSPTPHSDFQEKVLYLDSIGLDFFSLINHHASILSAPLPHIKSTVHFLLTSIGFTSSELHRLIGMCPEILSSRVAEIVPVLTFLLREARVNGSDLRRVLNRRPRLLACCVKTRLRPTLYFLQSIGISQVNKHTSLLSCSVEDKLQPRIDYLEKIGFSRRDALSMFRRFPQLFCYSIEQNFEPKFNYFVVEMGRDLKELKEFPHYFSFSLENRIRPRHQRCVEKGVCFPLHVLLKTSEVQFRDRLEIFCNSSIPFRNSPLWCTNSISDDLTYSHLNCCVICYL